MNKPCYNIPEFCDDHHLSKAFLYKLWEDGKGPRVMKVGNRTLITAEAAAEWRAKMEKVSAQPGAQ